MKFLLFSRFLRKQSGMDTEQISTRAKSGEFLFTCIFFRTTVELCVTEGPTDVNSFQLGVRTHFGKRTDTN